MRTTWTFGRIAGIPLKIHMNWFLTASLVTWALSVGYFPQTQPGWNLETYWVVGTATSFFFFLSVLLHELGHSLVALREKVRVNSITLFIFGGVAHIANEPPTAGAEFRIVAAGPLTSLGLAVAFSAVGWSGYFSSEISSAAVYLGQMNIILAVFNLLPGFPLDGGRILRAALWSFLKDFGRATQWATHAGIGMAAIFVLLGLAMMVWGDMFSGGWIAFVGWYLGAAAREGYRQVDLYREYKEDIQFAVNEEGPTWLRSGTLNLDRFSNSQIYQNSLSVFQPRRGAPNYILVESGRRCQKCKFNGGEAQWWKENEE
jgi:Zn-dependent protease